MLNVFLNPFFERVKFNSRDLKSLRLNVYIVLVQIVVPYLFFGLLKLILYLFSFTLFALLFLSF